jgi:hypothetical protein
MSGPGSAGMADQDVVDLGVVGRACGAVVSWYDDLVAGRDPSIARLDRALFELGALPPVGGCLGRAISVIARGGAPDSDATVAALELLRHAATCSTEPCDPAPHPKRATRRAGGYDVPLPGLGVDADDDRASDHAAAGGARP